MDVGRPLWSSPDKVDTGLCGLKLRLLGGAVAEGGVESLSVIVAVATRKHVRYDAR